MSGTQRRWRNIKVAIGAPVIGRAEVMAMLQALREKRLSQGKFVKAFEEAWAKYLGREHAIAVNSGSSANLLALVAMKEHYGWRDGDTILVPALTFATAVMPVLQVGLKPAWVDVDANGNITFENVLAGFRRHHGSRIKGIVVVHSLGVPCMDIVKIRRWAKANGLALLEDACESHGAEVKGKRVGAFGTVSTTSFYVAHNMTTGEGGMITTDDPKLAELCRSLREFGRRIDPKGRRYVHLASGPAFDIRYAFDRLGYNLRMTDIEASLGLVQLSKLDKMNNQRRRIVSWYRKGLSDLIARGLIVLPDEPAGTRNTYYTLLITFLVMPPALPTIEKIALALEAVGIETRPFMGGNLLRQKAFAGLGRPEHFPMAEFLHRRCLFFGCHPMITRRQVGHVCATIRRLYR